MTGSWNPTVLPIWMNPGWREFYKEAKRGLRKAEGKVLGSSHQAHTASPGMFVYLQLAALGAVSMQEPSYFLPPSSWRLPPASPSLPHQPSVWFEFIVKTHPAKLLVCRHFCWPWCIRRELLTITLPACAWFILRKELLIILLHCRLRCLETVRQAGFPQLWGWSPSIFCWAPSQISTGGSNQPRGPGSCSLKHEGIWVGGARKGILLFIVGSLKLHQDQLHHFWGPSTK